MEEKFSTIEGRFLAMKNWMKSQFGGSEEMMRKLMEMQSKTLLAILIANPNKYLIEIPLAKSKEKEIEQKKFDEESFFYQEPPHRALIRSIFGFSDGGTTMREFGGGGDRVTKHYGSHFEQGKWAIGDGEGRAEP
ncbi:hypothetical protein IEQ34_011807 [Dendrobium chrysotoxum]|uniref:Uncharacterized protein n=1 Tax=Dendrobium chrysotoxum TaxID=161865 RepID=A0AAV7GTE1_DENCH|nr:hypothetical protein IEQ34_011807 [Dendrobium chrysotoxum]